MATIEQRPDIETLAVAIARSPIVVRGALVRRRLPQAAARQPLPSGFEDADIAILDWIAEEGRRVGRSLIRI
jgi:hypothetical protein